MDVRSKRWLIVLFYFLPGFLHAGNMDTFIMIPPSGELDIDWRYFLELYDGYKGKIVIAHNREKSYFIYPIERYFDSEIEMYYTTEMKNRLYKEFRRSDDSKLVGRRDLLRNIYYRYIIQGIIDSYPRIIKWDIDNGKFTRIESFFIEKNKFKSTKRFEFYYDNKIVQRIDFYLKDEERPTYVIGFQYPNGIFNSIDYYWDKAEPPLTTKITLIENGFSEEPSYLKLVFGYSYIHGTIEEAKKYDSDFDFAKYQQFIDSQIYDKRTITKTNSDKGKIYTVTTYGGEIYNALTEEHEASISHTVYYWLDEKERVYRYGNEDWSTYIYYDEEPEWVSEFARLLGKDISEIQLSPEAEAHFFPKEEIEEDMENEDSETALPTVDVQVKHEPEEESLTPETVFPTGEELATQLEPEPEDTNITPQSDVSDKQEVVAVSQNGIGIWSIVSGIFVVMLLGGIAVILIHRRRRF